MKYGDLPNLIGNISVEVEEMMYYQYLPIKLKSQTTPTIEERLSCFQDIIGVILCDFVGVFGLDRFVSSYVYLTVKRKYQVNNCSFNRKGYHSDGFLTSDINYIWCDENPTEFNTSDFNLTLDDSISLDEMDAQAEPSKVVTFKKNDLLRLNQFNIHRVPDNDGVHMRTFMKVSFSDDKYDLKGNSINHLLDYKWDMRDRKKERNIPQQIKC